MTADGLQKTQQAARLLDHVGEEAARRRLALQIVESKPHGTEVDAGEAVPLVTDLQNDGHAPPMSAFGNWWRA